MTKGNQKLLKEYLRDAVKRMSDRRVSHDTFKITYDVDIINCETGEIYFSGSIYWITPAFISDNLVYDSEERYGHTIYFKEVK